MHRLRSHCRATPTLASVTFTSESNLSVKPSVTIDTMMNVDGDGDGHGYGDGTCKQTFKAYYRPHGGR